MIQIGKTCNVSFYANKVGINITHRQLVDLTARLHPESSLDIANNLANALILAYLGHERTSLADIARKFDIFLTKGLLDDATIYTMESCSDKHVSKEPLNSKILKFCLRITPDFGGGNLSQAYGIIATRL